MLCYEIDWGWKFYSEKHLTKLKYPHTIIMFTRRVCSFKENVYIKINRLIPQEFSHIISFSAFVKVL